MLKVIKIEGKGRGIITDSPILIGELIEACPVIILPSEDDKLIEQTFLYNYWFVWKRDPKRV